jgi:hypothetical protein
VLHKPSLSPKNASLMLVTGNWSLISIRGVSFAGQQGPAGTLAYGSNSARKGTARYERTSYFME